MLPPNPFSTSHNPPPLPKPPPTITTSLRMTAWTSSAIPDWFRMGEVQVLVASDAMTRGMDVEGVFNPVSYDAPVYIKILVHQAGQTARTGRLGHCYTILRKQKVRWMLVTVHAHPSPGASTTAPSSFPIPSRLSTPSSFPIPSRLSTPSSFPIPSRLSTPSSFAAVEHLKTVVLGEEKCRGK
ncbi:unnamed protein product [Closterium sp. Yama58-4]|nr:unnamed protein product [Closterium sp. Yama58-4]